MKVFTDHLLGALVTFFIFMLGWTANTSYSQYENERIRKGCAERFIALTEYNWDNAYAFYGIPASLRYKKVILGPRSLDAYAAYQMGKCRAGHKMVGE